MSTLSGVSSKGEKGKSKFQSLDINSLYHKTSKGESSEQQQTKSTAPRKHGMQSLGKVPSTRRAPVNLPSLKSEHSGSDPTVSLVPTGGTGWGSKPSEAAPPPITPTTPATTTSGQTQSTNVPAVVGTAPVQQLNITPTPPQPLKPVASVGGDKTWSSVMVGGESGGSGGGSGPSFLAHQSPQFQAEFPSLPGEGGAPGPPARAGEGGYGPGPSLRPQTEGSWAHGGGYQAPPPPQENQPRPHAAQFPPPPVSTPNMIPQFKGVIPSFMLGRGGSGGSGFPGMFPSNFQNSIRPPKFHNTSDNRLLGGGSRPPPLSDPDDLAPRPIIREEDLNRMDEISRDSGWATQDDIDYNQKLAFSDEETNGNDEEKEYKGKPSNINQMKEEKRDIETEKENRDRINMNEKMSEKTSHQPWQGRNPAGLGSVELRNPLTRLPSSNVAREIEMEDVWKEKRRQQSEQVAAVAEKAKQRKEEEEKRFEETRSKSEIEKKKKEDGDVEQEEKKDPGETFRQMTQLDSRNFSRTESQQSYRFASTLPPRFQKQQNIRQQQHQNSSESRWGGQHFSGNKQRLRGDSDEGKEKDDDKDKRERNTPEPSDRRDKDRESELDWDVRRGVGSAWEGTRNIDDKTSGRRDNKKIDNYKSHSSTFDDRDNEWRERSDNRDRSGRPDTRDNRGLRDNRPSREETRSLQESVVNNDFSWGDTEYEKDIQEEKVRRKESYKEERRETQTHVAHMKRDLHVPGPITREKMEAYEHRHSMVVPGPITKEKMEAYEHRHSMQAEKKELISTTVESRVEEDTWKKLDLSNINSSWADSEERTSPQQQDQKMNLPAVSQSQGSHISHLSSNQQNLQKQASTKSTELSGTSPSGGITDESSKDEKKDDGPADKKKDTGSGSLGGGSSNLGSSKDKDRGGGGRGGGRSNRGGARQNNYNTGNFNSIYYRGGSSAWASNKDSNRRGSSKPGKAWNVSESEGSGDEVSASTESGKEDKKMERKQTPRSPKTGERKKDKEDRNKESKKNESLDKSGPGGNLNRKPSQQQQLQPHHQQGQSQQQSGGSQGGQQVGGHDQQTTQGQQQQQSGYDSGGGRKEGFLPRGEPSRRGRGGFSRVPGGRAPVGAHYGPPGSKPAFPTPLTISNDQDANDSSSEEKKRAVITGRKDQRKSDSESSRSIKGKIGKIKREQEEWETTSEGSDSEAKGKQLRQNKKSMQRSGGDKRNMFSSGQMNGRPRSEDGKNDKNRIIKEDEDNTRFTNHSDIFHSNNGFQEVRSKKTGKDSRPMGKDDLKRIRGKEKGKGLQGGNSKGPQGKPFAREWNNKPPRMQRMAYLQQQQQNQQQDTVSDMNKINQNMSMFPIRGDVSCPAPAPPPPVNAWDKPITAALRTTPPPSAPNLHHLAPSITNSQDKTVIELNDHGPSGTSSQTSSPSAEKALSKLGREAVEKSFLDGSTPPVQTIVFENTNLKGAPSEMALKSKYPLKGQRIDKGRDRKLDEELDDTSPHMGLSFKPGSDIKPGENKTQEPIQMPMSFSKSEDNADMKLDFPFDSDLTHLTDEKTNIPRSIHQVLGQNSAADLNQKIASVKKVWETPGSMMEHQHHDEVVSTSSSFTPNFGSAVDTSLDHSSAHQVDDTTFTSDVYTSQNPSSNRTNYFIIAGPQIQGSAAGYTSGGANIMKQEPTNPTSNVKPQPQQAVISSAIGTHSGPSLSSPPPPFTQQGHFSYQTQYSNMPAIPSPPAVLINSAAAAASAQQVPPSHQGELFHSFPISGPTVIGSQQGRSGFSQYYGLGQSLGSTSAFSQQNLYHLPQPPPAPPNPDVFQSLGQYRIQPSAAYGQSQQLSNSPSTVLITSSSNSLMSASVKSSPQPPLGAIGSKAGYQSSGHPSQVPLGFIQYDATQMLPQNFLQNSPLVQRHGGNNVVPTIQPPTSFYSGSTGGQTGLFQPGSSILTGSGSQPAALHNATAFGMQGFGAQSATAPAQPVSTNPVGVQSYSSSQMGHFRGQAPTAAYLKAGTNPVTGQHTSDPAKSPSTSQDVINSVFSSTGGGGQIPSPKSRSSANSGAGTKQPQPPQQPSPTQGPPHHKFPPYQPQQNMVMQTGGGTNNHNQQGGGTAGGNRGPPMPQGVRTGASNGNGLSNNGVARYPTPIQRPVGVSFQSMQQRHRVPQQPRPQPTHQQHMKISNPYYQHQGNTVKLDVEGKDGDKLQEATNPTNKTEKKEEQTNSSDQ